MPERMRAILLRLSLIHISHIDIWHSVYNHVMASPEAITEWFKGSSLQPFLSPLNAADREKFLAAYTRKIIGAYKPRYDGKVLLRFPLSLIHI